MITQTRATTVYNPIHREQLLLNKTDYNMLAAMIDSQTAGEEQYDFDVTYRKGYFNLYVYGTVNREFETVAGGSYGSQSERYKQETSVSVNIGGFCAYDEVDDEVETDFCVDKLERYFD